MKKGKERKFKKSIILFSICKYIPCPLVLSLLVMNDSRCEVLVYSAQSSRSGIPLISSVWGVRGTAYLYSGEKESKTTFLPLQSLPFALFFLLGPPSQAPSLEQAPTIHL